MGGQAYLSLENSEDPFLHGIKFTAMPPSKRFREMEQLSGGEKVSHPCCHKYCAFHRQCTFGSEPFVLNALQVYCMEAQSE